MPLIIPRSAVRLRAPPLDSLGRSTTSPPTAPEAVSLLSVLVSLCAASVAGAYLLYSGRSRLRPRRRASATELTSSSSPIRDLRRVITTRRRRQSRRDETRVEAPRQEVGGLRPQACRASPWSHAV